MDCVDCESTNCDALDCAGSAVRFRCDSSTMCGTPDAMARTNSLASVTNATDRAVEFAELTAWALTGTRACNATASTAMAAGPASMPLVAILSCVNISADQLQAARPKGSRRVAGGVRAETCENA